MLKTALIIAGTAVVSAAAGGLLAAYGLVAIIGPKETIALVEEGLVKRGLKLPMKNPTRPRHSDGLRVVENQ